MSTTIKDVVALTTFAAVVRYGSFTAAAEALGESKSVVSRRLSALERRLGARLLHRTTRRLELTEVGLAVHGHCAGLLGQVEDAALAASAATGEPTGTLRMNLPSVLASEVVVPLLPALLARHPALRVELASSDRVVDVIGSGFDLTLRIGGRPTDASTVARRLAPVRLVPVASPAYLARAGVPRTPADLAALHDVRFTLLNAREEWRFEGPDGPLVAAPSTERIGADTGLVLIAALLQGMGVGMIPDLEVAHYLADGRLVRVLPDWPTPERWLWALWPHRTLVPPKVRVMVDHLVAHLGPELSGRRPS